MGAGKPVLAAAHMQQTLPKIQLLASERVNDFDPAGFGI
jgi:hypothetical protein